MTALVRAAAESAIAIVLIGVGILGQITEELPGAAWLTGAAGVVGVVAIGQMVRAIAATDRSTAEIIEALREQLAEARAENTELRDELHRLLGSQHRDRPDT